MRYAILIDFKNPEEASFYDYNNDDGIFNLLFESAAEAESFVKTHLLSLEDYRIIDIENDDRNEEKELRDKFAMTAMQGLLAADINDDYSFLAVAKDAYDIADAMLAERNKR